MTYADPGPGTSASRGETGVGISKPSRSCGWGLRRGGVETAKQ